MEFRHQAIYDRFLADPEGAAALASRPALCRVPYAKNEDFGFEYVVGDDVLETIDSSRDPSGHSRPIKG
jgi:hypothetical protein